MTKRVIQFVKTTRVSQMFTYKNLTVKKATNGLGIHTTAEFKAGQTMFRINGTRKHYTTLLERGGTFLDNCFRISENYYLSPEGHIGVYLNHSCEPNAKVVKNGQKLFVYTITHLPKGAEVLIDYSTITASDDIWTMRCNCGAATCRKIIRNFSKLPVGLQQKYKNAHIVPQYIVNL